MLLAVFRDPAVTGGVLGPCNYWRRVTDGALDPYRCWNS